MGKSNTIRLVVSAALTMGLYVAFFAFTDPLMSIFTSRTLMGAVAVLAAAALFTLIHGAFANYLLQALGLNPSGR